MDTYELVEQTKRSEAPWSVDQAIAVACLAGRAALGSVHVAVSPRPTYGELLRYRQLAADCGFSLAVTGSGVVLRPAGEGPLAAVEPVGLWTSIARLWNRARQRRSAPATKPRSSAG